MAPPEWERPGEDTGPSRASVDSTATDKAQRNAGADTLAALRRRRAASRRVEPLGCGCVDPWTCRHHDALMGDRSALDAAGHLFALGLPPLFDPSTIRRLWRSDRVLAVELARLAGLAA